MKVSLTIAALAAAGLAFSAAHATTRPLHHYRHQAYHRHGHAPYAHNRGYAPAPYAYYGGAYGAQQIIENATIRAQHEPGVTSELAPDAKQTATGGPVGGVPGFSGF